MGMLESTKCELSIRTDLDTHSILDLNDNFIFFLFLIQARIAFLQGERKGQENLKQDLVRRIKMLEFALKQER